MRDVRHQVVAGEPSATTRRVERERRLAELARRQYGVVAHDQLEGLGFGRQAIRHRLTGRRLTEVHPRVYAVGAAPINQHGLWWAALLATRPLPCLSHLSSAAKLGIARERDGVHITATHGRGRTLQGVTLHRSRALHPDDLTRIDGLPLTTLARTLLDLAETEPLRRLEKIVEEADRRELLDPAAIVACADRNPGRHGLAVLMPLVDRYVPTPGAKEGLEREFALFLEDRGLPAPERNVIVHDVLVDCWWPEGPLVVELDSREFHEGWDARERDIGRDAHLLRHRVPTLRVTSRRLSHDPDGLDEDLVSLLRLPQKARSPQAGRRPCSGRLQP
jgi:hypothetical protein